MAARRRFSAQRRATGKLPAAVFRLVDSHGHVALARRRPRRALGAGRHGHGRLYLTASRMAWRGPAFHGGKMAPPDVRRLPGEPARPAE